MFWWKQTFDKLIQTNFISWLLPGFPLPAVSTEFRPEVDLLLQLVNLRLSLCQSCQAASLGSGQILPGKFQIFRKHEIEKKISCEKQNFTLPPTAKREVKCPRMLDWAGLDYWRTDYTTWCISVGLPAAPPRSPPPPSSQSGGRAAWWGRTPRTAGCSPVSPASPSVRVLHSRSS